MINDFTYKKRPRLIAEISANHNSSKQSFLKHILEANKAGADYVKIQTYEPEDISINKNIKIKSGLWKGKNLWSLYSITHTPFEWHYNAFELAKKNNIKLFSTPFSIRAVKFLDQFKVDLYKISSFEITDLRLIDEIAKRKKLIIISTGNATLAEIKNAKKIINKYHNKIIILHCVSDYPTKIQDANINNILNLKKKFKENLIGLSDHTENITSSLAATSLGVVAIEKHFIINKKMHSEDSQFSIDIEQFKKLKIETNNIFLSLGFNNIIFNKIDKKSIFYRRGIYAKSDIKKGDIFTKNNLITLRPKLGLGAENFFKILNKKSNANYRYLQPIKYKI